MEEAKDPIEIAFINASAKSGFFPNVNEEQSPGKLEILISDYYSQSEIFERHQSFISALSGTADREKMTKEISSVENRAGEYSGEMLSRLYEVIDFVPQDTYDMRLKFEFLNAVSEFQGNGYFEDLDNAFHRLVRSFQQQNQSKSS